MGLADILIDGILSEGSVLGFPVAADALRFLSLDNDDIDWLRLSDYKDALFLSEGSV